MPKSRYILQIDEKTFCPKCHKTVYLMCDRYGTIGNKPWFYICFPCQLIAELGKGEVEKEQTITQERRLIERRSKE